MDCWKWFYIDHKRKEEVLIDYIDGKPIRKIADKENKSPATILRQIKREIEKLPHNNEITKIYCSRFCGILVVDGKYVKVKGYEKKIPLLWGLDYLSHDIPVYRFAPSESYEAWLKYFGYLKSIQYPMKMIICDDNENIRKAGQYIFPNALIQLCQNHFLENIRKDLHVRTEDKYKQFVQDLKKDLFNAKIMIKTFRKRSYQLFRKYEKDDKAVRYILKINEYTQELTAAAYLRKAPRTTNIIESFNSHLQGRLKTIKGFESFDSADKWLNCYILRRRVKVFTDCCRKFGYLNGKSALTRTLKKHAEMPLLF